MECSILSVIRPLCVDRQSFVYDRRGVGGKGGKIGNNSVPFSDIVGRLRPSRFRHSYRIAIVFYLFYNRFTRVE